MGPVLFDHEAEATLIGTVFHQNGTALHSVQWLASEGLREHHFHLPLHRDVFAAMLSLADHAAGVDPVTVVAELDRLGRVREDASAVHALASIGERSGDLGAYARRVREISEWRHAREAVLDMEAAIEARDRPALMKAVGDLEQGVRERHKDTYGPTEMADLLFEFLSSGEGAPDWVIPLPFQKLNDAQAGGLWPGELMVLGGATNAGKSVLGDMILDHAAEKGFQAHCYMTEMTALARGLRYLTRRTGVPFPKLRARDLTDKQLRLAIRELQTMKWGLSIVSDWTVEEVVSDALRARHHLVFIDLLHGFHYADERELDQSVKHAARLARTSTTIEGFAGTAVIAGVHLQHNAPERPTHDHIKGGGSPKQDADSALFVRQKKPKEGASMENPECEVYITKGRSSDKASLSLILNGRRFRFELPPQPGDTGALAAKNNADMPF